MSNQWKLAAIALALFGTTQVTACGGAECGEGTTDKDGTCVVKTKISCGEGTKLVEDSCVLEQTPVTCADGTTLTGGVCTPNVLCGDQTMADATGKCVPTYAEVTCATGTMLSEGVCVPSPQVCAPGTTFNNGTCAPDVVCGDATTARDGKCLSDEDLLKLDADLTEGAGENDPTYGGSPVMITLPAASSSTTILGSIDAPTDKNQDTILDQDVDYYAFTATAGTFLNIKALNKGAGALAFVIEGPNGYQRLAPTQSASPERQLLLPYDGEYRIIVGPARQLYNLSVGPDGGPGRDYLLVIENLGPFDLSAAPELDAAAGQTAQGRFMDLRDNAFKIKSGAGELVQLSLPAIDVDALASVILMDGAGQVIGESGVSVRNGIAYAPAMENGLSVVVDYVRLAGPRDAFTIQAKKPGVEALPSPLKGDQTVTLDSTLVIEAGQSAFIEVDVQLQDAMDQPIPQGTVVLVRLPQGLGARAYGPDNKLVEGFRGLPGFVARIGGKYTIEVINPDSLRPVEVSGVAVQSYIPANFGQIARADAQRNLVLGEVPAGDFKFFLFETTDPMGLDFEVKQTTAPATTLIVAHLGTDLSVGGAFGGAAPSYSFEGQAFPEPKRHVGLLLVNAARAATGAEVTLVPKDLPAAEAEPNGTQATATVIADNDTTLVGTLVGGPKQDIDIFRAGQAVTEPSLLTATVSLRDGEGNVVVELRDNDGMLYDATDAADDLTVGAIVQPGKQYFVHVYSDEGFETISYTVSLSVEGVTTGTPETEPNNSRMEATTILPQLMPSFSFTAVGTLVGQADEDWFTLNIPTDGQFRFSLEGIDGLSLPQPGLSFELFEDDGTGNLTLIDTSAVAQLTRGPKLIKVSGASASGFGNSYQVKGAAVTEEDAGTLGLDLPVDLDGTFDGTGIKLITFTLAQDLALDGSQALTVWSDAPLQVLNSQGMSVFTPLMTGNGPIGAGFLSNTLTAGTYTVQLTGAAGSAWMASIGLYSFTQEDEAINPLLDNDSVASAQDLGVISATPKFVFGTVDDIDGVDFFAFTVPDVNNGMPVSVTVKHMQFGASIYDVDLNVVNSAGSIIDFSFPYEGWDAPQFVTRQLLPGTYYAVSEFYDPDGGTSGQYLIRVAID